MTTERRERRGTAANVEVTENPRIQSNSARRRTAAFIARNEGKAATTRETDASGVTTEHNRPGTIIMYKPSETMGWIPRTVSVSSIRLLLQQGWSEFCPDCGGEHLDRNGQVSTNPNLCKARPPIAEAVCPVCRKRLFDNQATQVGTEDEDDNPNLIRFEESLTTPAQRMRMQLDLHLWSKHPRQAQMMGRPPLPQALREIAESVQASV